MLKKYADKRWFRIVSNKYFFTGLPFVVWMIFFDSNSWLMQRQLNEQINKLNESINYYSTELERDRVALRELESNPEAFEKYAREKFWMLKDGEEIYVFETQTED